MRCAFALTLCSSAAAGSINLSLSDCGDTATRAHVTSLNPTTIEQGIQTKVTGKGSFEGSDVKDGNFTSTVKALGVVLKTCYGDICKQSTCDLPQGTGSIVLDGIACPQSAGEVSINFHVLVAASIPSALAVLEVELKGDSHGEKLLCAKINTSPAIEAEAV